MPHILRNTVSILTSWYREHHASRLFVSEKGLSVSHVKSEGEQIGRRVFGVGFGFSPPDLETTPVKSWRLYRGLPLRGAAATLIHSTHTLHPIASPQTPTATLLPCWPWYTCHNDAIITDTPCVSFLLATALEHHVTDDRPPCRTNTITTTTLSFFPSSS